VLQHGYELYSIVAYIDSSGHAGLDMTHPSGTTYTALSKSDVPSATWSTIAFRFDNPTTTMSIWFDGVDVTDTSANPVCLAEPRCLHRDVQRLATVDIAGLAESWMLHPLDQTPVPAGGADLP
jgi:hypothetical protein